MVANASSQPVLFLNRAYNDFDMQASLMVEFAESGFKDISVVGLIADGEIAEPTSHELAPILVRRYGVSIKRVTELPGCPRALCYLSSALSFVRRKRFQNKAFFELLKPIDLLCRTLIRKLINNIDPWLEALAEQWKDHIVLVDEIAFHKARSPIADKTLPLLIARGTSVYVIKTGHHIYHDPNPSGAVGQEIEKRAVRFFSVSGPVDEEIERQSKSPQLVRRYGNPRMNPAWIRKLESVSLIDCRNTTKLPDPQDGKIRISIMLSKINYGVDVEALKETLSRLSRNPKVQLVIKPHTRGMKFDFMPLSSIPGAFLADRVPSTLLINWSDLVLFTGSSIVFHAMLLGKEAGYLNYVQRHETIFEADGVCRVLNSYEDLSLLVEAMCKKTLQPLDIELFESFLKRELYGSDGDPNVAAKIISAVCEEL